MDGRGDCVRGLFQSLPENYHIGKIMLAPAMWTTALQRESGDDAVTYSVTPGHWGTRSVHVGLIRRDTTLIEEDTHGGLDGENEVDSPVISNIPHERPERRILVSLANNTMDQFPNDDTPTVIILSVGTVNMRVSYLNAVG
jgi:hypothetical protein